MVSNIIEEAKQYLALSNTDTLEVVDIESQKVKIAFIPIRDNFFIELIEPKVGNKSLNKLLKKNTNFYHLGYVTQNFDLEVKNLVDSGYKRLPVFNSEAFNMKRCIFLLNHSGHLIEVIED